MEPVPTAVWSWFPGLAALSDLAGDFRSRVFVDDRLTEDRPVLLYFERIVSAVKGLTGIHFGPAPGT